MFNNAKLVAADIAIIIIFFLLSSTGYCAFNEQLAITTKAISLANAVTANPPGIMSIHYNPAGLSLLGSGKWFYQGLTVPYIKKTSKFDRNPNWPGIFGGFKDDPILDKNGHAEGTNTSGKMFIPIINQPINFLISPTMGIAYRRPGSKWTFAFGNYAPFAVGLIHNHRNDPARWGGWEVYQQHLIYAAPSVSYQIKDNLSIGLTVGIGQTAMGARVDMRNPNELVSLTRILGNATKDLEIPVISELTLPPPWFGGGIGPYDKIASLKVRLRDDFSPNYNVGVLWSPFKWLSLGVCYQSPIKVQLRGKYIIEYSEQWQKMMNWLGSSPLLLQTSGMLDLPTQGIPNQRGRLTTEIEFPQRVQAGIKLTLLNKINLMFDVKWANWSVIQQDNFRFDQPIQLLRVAKMSGYTGGNYNLKLNRNFKDTLDWAVGIEYMLNDKITLRAGYEWRDSPVRDNLFDLLYALPDLHFFGVGVSIKLPKKITLDVGAAYLFNKGYKVPDNSSKNLNSNVFTDVVYNPYAGLNYKQDTETYMLSVSATMPFETMKDLMHHQTEMLKKAASILMFFKHKKKGEKEAYIEKVKNISSSNKLNINKTNINKTKNKDLLVKIPEPILSPKEQIKNLVYAFIKYWENAEIDKFISFYTPYSIKGNLIGKKAIYKSYKDLWSKNRPKRISIKDMHIWKSKKGYWVRFVQGYEAENGYKDRGITTLYLEKVNGFYKILNHQWKRLNQNKPKPKKIKMVHEKIQKKDIIDLIYKWKKSWKSHNINNFIKFYSPYSIKGKLIGKSSIMDYYKKLWSKDLPKDIYIANIRISRSKRGYVAEFIQEYISQKGYRDIGIVSLIVENTDNGLKIINQQWRPIKDLEIKGLFESLIKWIDTEKTSDIKDQAKFYAPYVIKDKKIGLREVLVTSTHKKATRHITPMDIREIKIQKLKRGFNTCVKMVYKDHDKKTVKDVQLLWERIDNLWKVIAEVRQ